MCQAPNSTVRKWHGKKPDKNLYSLKIHLKKIIFIFVCAWSSLLPEGFLWLQGARLSVVAHGLLIADAFVDSKQALGQAGFSSCGSPA